MKKYRHLLLAFLSFVLTFGFYERPCEAETVDSIEVIVNNQIITASDLKDFETKLKTGGLVDDQLVPDEQTRQSLLKDHKALLEKLIDARLIDAEVKRQGLSIPIERLEQEIRTIAKRNGMQRDELKNALLEKGIDFSSYQDFIKTGLERQSIVEKAVTSKIKISEDDVLTGLMAEGRNMENQAFEYTIAQILFLNSKDQPGSKAIDRARKAYEKLNSGTTFERVASSFSEGPNLEEGGLLGNFKTGDLPKSLEREIINTKQGDWTKPLPTNGGYHIIKLIKLKLIPDPKIEKEKDRLRAILGEKAFRRQYQLWLETLRSEAFIRRN